MHKASSSNDSQKYVFCYFKLIRILVACRTYYLKKCSVIVLRRVKDLLLKRRRRDQSVFTAGNVHNIQEFQLIKTRCKYQKPRWFAYVKLKAVFDSLNWNHSGADFVAGPLAKTVGSLCFLYSDALSCVRLEWKSSEWLAVQNGSRCLRTIVQYYVVW